MKVLVCGGAGYIGSHIVRELLNTHEVVIVDNLSTGHVESIPEGVLFEQGNISDKDFLDRVFSTHKPEAVMHFCASIEVAESCRDPLSYYENNVSATIILLQAMRKHGVKVISIDLLSKAKLFIFSSTAALFGYPETSPIKADAATFPINAYGDTKLAVETLLGWCDSAYGIKSVCLRYFNACGAIVGGEIGEDHACETHLIPIILQVALGKRESISVFGDDYETEDGTCVRDYVHVSDLASAHIAALEYLHRTGVSERFNLGSGTGFSVMQVIESARRVTGRVIKVIKGPRRTGDPDRLVACSEKAEQVLGWTRKFKGIDEIVKSAWIFHQKYPNGFRG